MSSNESSGQKRWSFLTGRLHTDVLAIATGEGVARLCNLILVVFVSRAFGVRAAGAYAMALALYLYQMNGTDFGLRQTGARLVAKNPDHIRRVVRFIQRRRILLALLTMALGYWYGRFGPVPQDARPMVSLYALAIFGYGLSVDWLAWGMQRFAVMSGWRAMVSLMNVTFTIVCVVSFHAGLLVVPVAAALANLLAGGLLWVFWARRT
ncbi:MAG TPA: oligosaccharide flippase family protein, partial [Ktedonobacteraceae bacterium]|nr:oligosaccharide flippase family protein [Ktedonobacteraceae bacterium]